MREAVALPDAPAMSGDLILLHATAIYDVLKHLLTLLTYFNKQQP